QSSDEEMLGQEGASSPPPASSENGERCVSTGWAGGPRMGSVAEPGFQCGFTSSSEAESTEPVRYPQGKRRRGDHPAVVSRVMVYQPICRGLPITHDDVGTGTEAVVLLQLLKEVKAPLYTKKQRTSSSSSRAKDRYITIPGKDLETAQLTYTADSDLVSAVVHDGRFDPTDTPTDLNGLKVLIEVEMLSPVTHFLKVERNGITSRFRTRRSQRPTLAYTVVSVEPLVGRGSPLADEATIQLYSSTPSSGDYNGKTDATDSLAILRFLQPYRGPERIDSTNLWLQYSPLYVLPATDSAGRGLPGYSRLYREDMHFCMDDLSQYLLRMEDPETEGDDPRFQWIDSSSEGSPVTGLTWSEIEWGFRSLRVRGQPSRAIKAIRFGIRDHVIGQLAASDMKWFNKVAAQQPLARGDVESTDLEVGCGSSISSEEDMKDTTMATFGERTADTDASEEEDSNLSRPMVPRPHRHVEVPNRSTIFGYIGEGSLCGGKTKFAMLHDTLVMMVPKEFDPKTCGRPPRRVPNAHRQERPRGISREDWKRRYIMWSRYDEGIEMDRAAWFEVTPENIARFTAEEIYARYGDAAEVVDGCAGVGGNAIQFALQSRGRGGQVVACDISEARLEIARHNAAVYGVAEGKVKYLEGDVRACKPSDTKSLLFLSPPWGGPSCYSTPVYDPASCELTDWATSPACRFNRVVLYLPRHTDLNALVEMCMRAGPIPLLEILVIRYTSPEPHTKALLVFIDRSASPRLPVPPLVFWRGSVAAALLRTLMTKPPLTGALGSMAASAAGEKMDAVADLMRRVSERLGLRREEVLGELDRLRRREISLRRVAGAVREADGGKDDIGKLLGNLTDCLGVRALLSMATTVSSSSSTTSAPPSKSTAAEGHAAEQANHNMRFLQYRSSQNSSRVGANYQAVVPLVLPSKERKEIALRQKEVARPDEKRRSPKLTELAAGLCDTIMQRSSAGPFLQADVDTVMDALEARGPLPAAVVSGRREADWYEESTMVSSSLSARTLRRNQWQVEEVRGLGRGLEGLERWKREVEAVVGGERKLTLPEATALWSEGRVLEKIFDGLHPQVAALHRLISPAEAFEARVLQDRWQREEREQLVKEGEALRVLPARALRHLSSTDASTTVKPAVSSSATPALSEWTGRAKAKLEGKRSRVPLHVVMELLDDLNARGLTDDDTSASSEIVGVLEEAKDAGMAWRERASRALAVDDAQLSGKGLVEGVECGGALSVVGLRELWEEHYQLPRVCVPEVCRRLESLMRRATAWEERCHRLLEGAPRSAVEGRMVLEEIRQSGIAKAVDLSKCLNSVKSAVERGE
ncbi:Trimethylguanosine synthase, partial [Perkinsus olseni]